MSYTTPSNNGSLTFTPAANASGTATIIVTVTDNGGTANGGVNTFSQAFTVNVNPINQPPTLDPIPNPRRSPRTRPRCRSINLTGITAGPATRRSS